MSRHPRHHWLIVLFSFGIGAREVTVEWGKKLYPPTWYGPYWWNHTIIGCNKQWCNITAKCHSSLTPVFPKQWCLQAILSGATTRVMGSFGFWSDGCDPCQKFFSSVPLKLGDSNDTLIVWYQSVRWFLLCHRCCHHPQAQSLRVFGA